MREQEREYELEGVREGMCVYLGMWVEAPENGDV